MSPRGDAPGEADLLAPWAATDRLDAADAAAFRRMLADDPDLARGLGAAEEEREATVTLNDALPAASAASREKLFALIEAHEAAKPAARAGGVMRRFGAWIAALSPNALAWGAAAAALLIAVQGGLILRSAVVAPGGGYEMASAEDGGAERGDRALVAFQPGATAGEIATLLGEVRAEIVAGPKPGGVFVVRFPDGERERALAKLAARRSAVRLAKPETD